MTSLSLVVASILFLILMIVFFLFVSLPTGLSVLLIFFQRTSFLFHWFSFFNVYLFILREREREYACMHVSGEGQREREIENPTQALHCQGSTWGSIPWATRSWPEPTEPPRHLNFLFCFPFSPSLFSALMFIYLFLWSALDLVCSSFSSFLQWELRLIILLFFLISI